MQQLEGLQYVTALDPNMGYCNIRLLTASQDMAEIFTELEKFRYNCLQMGMCASGYILQAKVDKILSDTKVVETYINDIVVLIKERFAKHIYH